MNAHLDQLAACPCCGQLTLSESGVYEICGVCHWEDDPVQSTNASYVGGANRCSLRQARERWMSEAKSAYGNLSC
jgi:hypothetical protein